MTDKNDKPKLQQEENDEALKPDPKTLNTTDPQDEMEGPLSSLVQGAKEGLEDNKTKEEADKEKDSKM